MHRRYRLALSQRSQHRSRRCRHRILLPAGTAGANTKDEAFIAQMESIMSPSPHRRCHPASPAGLQEAGQRRNHRDQPRRSSQTNSTTKQAAYFVVDATKAYCPQYASQLTAATLRCGDPVNRDPCIRFAADNESV